jgi:hypothetical protein
MYSSCEALTAPVIGSRTLCVEVPAGGPFVVEANAFVAVGCKLMTHGFAV